MFSVNDPSGKATKFYEEHWQEVDKEFLNGSWPAFLKQFQNK